MTCSRPQRRPLSSASAASAPEIGMMAVLKQLHSDWSVQELNALACETATHDLFTTTAQTTQFGIGRVGAGDRHDGGVETASFRPVGAGVKRACLRNGNA